jgi:hypothetical protein
VDSKSLHDEVVALFEAKDIPFTNLMSMLLDSCNVVRGTKTSFEVCIREEPLICWTLTVTPAIMLPRCSANHLMVGVKDYSLSFTMI